MAGKQLSYDYVNIKRDLGDSFMQVIQSSPVLSEMISVTGQAKATKHERLQDVVSQRQREIDADYTAADGTITLVTSAGVKVGDILEFELSTGVLGTFNALVTAVNIDGVTISVSTYGGTVDQNMLATSKVFLLSRPKNEATSPSADNGYEPSTEYNYTQIFDRTAKVSKTAAAESKYGIGGAVNYQVERQLKDIAYEMNRTMLRSARVQRTSSVAGTMGGIMWFLKQATGNSVDAVGAGISQTIINNALEIAGQNGEDNITTLLCNPLQARKISAFNTTGNNPYLMRQDTTTGSYVTTFVSDQGKVLTIVADRNFAKSEVALLDMSKVNLVPYRAFTDENAAGNGDDFYARRILGEYTLEVKNAAECHVYIYGLAV